MCVNYRALNSYTINNEAGLRISSANWTYVPGITKLESMRMILESNLNVRIKPSTIPHAGFGVFAAKKHFEKGKNIIPYEG